MFFEKDEANIEEKKELIHCISEDKKRVEILIGVIDSTKEKISLNSFLIQPLLQSVSKTIIEKFC